MKRGTPYHPKTFMLAEQLGVNHREAVGCLELLFQFTSKFAPRGDVGKWPDSAIAKGCLWDGDPQQFIRALIEARWLEPCATHRLVVHDWSDHRDDMVRKALERLGLEVVVRTPPTCAVTVTGDETFDATRSSDKVDSNTAAENFRRTAENFRLPSLAISSPPAPQGGDDGGGAASLSEETTHRELATAPRPRKPLTSAETDPPTSVVAAWNGGCGRVRAPPVEQLSHQQRRSLGTRIREHPSLAVRLDEELDLLAERHRGRSWFTFANVVLNATNLRKIMAGTYREEGAEPRALKAARLDREREAERVRRREAAARSAELALTPEQLAQRLQDLKALKQRLNAGAAEESDRRETG